MKRLLILLLLSMNYISANGWPTVSHDQAEKNRIQQHIATILNRFTSMGASLSSPAIQTAIKDYLQSVGTPVSYEIYKEMYPTG